MSKLFESMEKKTTKELQSRVKSAYAWGGKAASVDAREKFRTTLTSIAFASGSDEFSGRYTGSELVQLCRGAVHQEKTPTYFFLRDLVKTTYILALRGIFRGD